MKTKKNKQKEKQKESQTSAYSMDMEINFIFVAQKDERVMVKHQPWFIILVNIQNNKKTLKSSFFLPGELCMVSLI